MNASSAWMWVLAILLAGSSVMLGQPGAEPPTPPPIAPIVPGTPESVATGPLLLEEVIHSVSLNYPLLLAVEREREIAGGRLLSTMGAFDTNLRASTNNQPLATFENYRTNIGIDQAFTHTGATVFSGYRTGFGDFPVYYGDRKTADGGEFRSGVIFPLLRDRDIDRRRANLAQSQIDRALVEPTINRSRLDFYRAASRAYWSWVVSGKRVELARSMFKLASDRDAQIAERVKAGAAAQIERIDNQQNIALRGGMIAQSEQLFQQASIDLSLFLRDPSGEAQMPTMARLPTFPRMLTIDPTQFDSAIQAAYQNRPEFRRLTLQRDRLKVELRWSQNQTLPGVNAFLTGSQDVGATEKNTGPDRLDRSNLDMGVEVTFPVQRRDAQGRVAVVQAQLSQLGQQERYTRDLIRAEVQSTWTALERTYIIWTQASKRVELARRVADAEREQLRLGRSDILRVTQRETAAFEAELSELGAKFDYFRTLADYRAALGIDVKNDE